MTINIRDLAMNFLTNDLDIQNNDLYGVAGQVAIQQDIQQTLQFWYGEWFLDTTKGVPYKQYILVKNPNIDLVQGLLLKAIQARPGVVQVLDFQFNYDPINRAVAITTVVQITNGQIFTVKASVAPPALGTIQGVA